MFQILSPFPRKNIGTLKTLYQEKKGPVSLSSTIFVLTTQTKDNGWVVSYLGRNQAGGQGWIQLNILECAPDGQLEYVQLLVLEGLHLGVNHQVCSESRVVDPHYFDVRSGSGSC
jgi:hypothetical protein